MRHNVFLHFLNRDANLLGIGKFVRKGDHTLMLSRALNISVMLCDEFCIAPPGFLLETETSFEISHRRRQFITNGIVKLARKESTMDDYVEKKRREYAVVSDSFQGLFNDKYILQLISAMPYFILRKISVGLSATKNWEQGADSLESWRVIREQFSSKALSQLSMAPRKLLDNGVALTWESLTPYLTEEMLGHKQEIRLLLQHNYFALYTQEYNLIVLDEIPLFSTNFDLPIRKKSYSFWWFKTALLQIKSSELIDASAELICFFIRDSRFIEFINLYIKLAELTSSINDFRLILDKTSKHSKISWDKISVNWKKDKKSKETFLNDIAAEDFLKTIEEFSYHIVSQIKDLENLDLHNLKKSEFDISGHGVNTNIFNKNIMECEKVVIATANLRESQAIIDILRLEAERMEKQMIVELDKLLPYTKGYLPRKFGLFEIFVVRADDTGGLDAANLLRRIFDKFTPSYIFYVGCAALLDEKYEHEDNLVFVASRAIDSDKRSLIEGEIEYDFDLEKSDITIIRNINVLNDNGVFSPIKVITNRYFISGSAFSNDKNSSFRKDLITRFPKDAVVLEMEAFSILKEAKKYLDEGRQFKYGVIKGISDVGDEMAHLNKNELQKKATENAFMTVLTLLKNL